MRNLQNLSLIGSELVLELMMLVIVLRAQLVTEQSQQRRQRLPRWWQEGCAHATSAANEDHPQWELSSPSKFKIDSRLLIILSLRKDISSSLHHILSGPRLFSWWGGHANPNLIEIKWNANRLAVIATLWPAEDRGNICYLHECCTRAFVGGNLMMNILITSSESCELCPPPPP